jgi:hypothetical protein
LPELSTDDIAPAVADRRAIDEAARLQTVIAGIRERRGVAEAEELAIREQAMEAKRAQVMAIRSEGIKHLRASEASLRAGDHRLAWQLLHRDCEWFFVDEAPPRGVLKGSEFWPVIEADPEVRNTAMLLEQRIQWSFKHEQEQAAREARGSDLASDPLIDFESLDAHITQSSRERDRPRVVGIIYTITMPDGEVYVGKTTRKDTTRWSEHAREAAAGDRKPKSLAIRYWTHQERAGDIRWKVEESVLGWSEQDLAAAERRWMRIGTLNVMDAKRAATKYPSV